MKARKLLSYARMSEIRREAFFCQSGALKVSISRDCKTGCVTLDSKIKETTQTTNQIKCEWALTHPLSVI